MSDRDKFFKIGQDYAEESNQELSLIFNSILDNEDLAGRSEYDFAMNLQGRFNQEKLKFFNRPNVTIDAKTLEEFLDSLEENELISFSVGFSTRTDYDLPEPIMDKLKNIPQSSQDKILEELFELAPDKKDQKDESLEDLDEIYLATNLLTVLSNWPNLEIAKKIIDWYTSSSVADERIGDAIVEYLVQVGPVALPALYELLEEKLDYNSSDSDISSDEYEFLLQAITNIAIKNHKHKDDVYKVLRQVFKHSDKKTYVTNLLGDLGHARAIVLLKGHVDKNQATISEGLYYDIVAALQKLGADLTDFPNLGSRFLGNRNRG